MVKKFILNVSMEERRNAMTKAKSDVLKFAGEVGYTPINISQIDNRLKRFFLTNERVSNILAKFNPFDELFIQYPTYLGQHFEKKLFDGAIKNKIKLTCIIHDLDTLRFEGNKWPTIDEIVEELDKFDDVIVSNSVMGDLLKSHGLNSKLIDLRIFDYFHDVSLKSKNKGHMLNFAGNLDKSKFFQDFDTSQSLNINLYGKLSNQDKVDKKFNYRGSFLPDKLPGEFSEGFGLVWDGNSSQGIKGKLGEYQKYNNPHKVSLYLSSGLPVVIWEKAALAEFIKLNNVGITVSSLNNLDIKIAEISDLEYNEMVANAKELSTKLKSGYFTKRALAEIS